MALAYDDQIPAVSPTSRQELVTAVLTAPSTESEPSWLEWKGSIDGLRSWAPRIGFYVLGFANRPVEWAQRNAGGWGYLLLGVEPGVAHGISPVDTADLIKWIGPYLGTRGPQWDPHFIEVEGATVLLIGVPPPRAGDPLYPVRRSFHGTAGGKQVKIEDGEVIIRAGSETRRARADELELLMARAAGGGPQLSVTVIDRSERFVAIDTRDEHRDAWLASERERLLAPIGARHATDDTVRALFREKAGGIAGSLALGMETRSPQEYRSEVDRYLDKARDSWLARVTKLAAKRRLAELRLQVRNETAHNFRAVELEIYAPGRIIAGWEGELDWPDLPRRPEPWASRTNIVSRLAISPTLLRSPLFDTPLPASRTGRIDNSGSARITFDEFDLRPEVTYDLEPVILVIGEEHVGQTLEATWKLTSKSVSGTARGALSFQVAADPTTPQELMHLARDDEDMDDPDA